MRPIIAKINIDVNVHEFKYERLVPSYIAFFQPIPQHEENINNDRMTLFTYGNDRIVDFTTSLKHNPSMGYMEYQFNIKISTKESSEDTKSYDFAFELYQSIINKFDILFTSIERKIEKDHREDDLKCVILTTYIYILNDSPPDEKQCPIYLYKNFIERCNNDFSETFRSLLLSACKDYMIDLIDPFIQEEHIPYVLRSISSSSFFIGLVDDTLHKYIRVTAAIPAGFSKIVDKILSSSAAAEIAYQSLDKILDDEKLKSIIGSITIH